MTTTATVAGRRTGSAPAAMALAIGVAALGAMFHVEVQAAVRVWLTSTAYGHCILILPMAAYLVWDRRESLAGLAAHPIPWLAVMALPLAAAWFLAERLGIMEGRQLVAMAALELLVLAVLGWRTFGAVLGPMLYLLFLVPFGAFATPALQHVTAVMAIAGLNLLGIPNYSTDLTIEISAGTFYVAEACAGLRFLIAAIAFGVFYALLNYRSPGRRAVFIAASIIVPILANGLRALGIIVLGHMLGSAEAAAADHIIYGWVFFSFVLLLLVAAGLPLREPRLAASPFHTVAAIEPGASPFWPALATAAVMACGPALALALDSRSIPAPVAASPQLGLPADCIRIGEAHTLPATRLEWQVVCGGRTWIMTMQTFPARSTADALTAQRRRATGELEAEEASATSLATASPDNGQWRVVETWHPDRITATAAWVDGEPARPGLAGRIQQARNSLLGSEHAPVLISLSTALPSRLPPEQRTVILGELRNLLDAQSGLTAQVEALSRAAR